MLRCYDNRVLEPVCVCVCVGVFVCVSLSVCVFPGLEEHLVVISGDIIMHAGLCKS